MEGSGNNLQTGNLSLQVYRTQDKVILLWGRDVGGGLYWRGGVWEKRADPPHRHKLHHNDKRHGLGGSS